MKQSLLFILLLVAPEFAADSSSGKITSWADLTKCTDVTVSAGTEAQRSGS